MDTFKKNLPGDDQKKEKFAWQVFEQQRAEDERINALLKGLAARAMEHEKNRLLDQYESDLYSAELDIRKRYGFEQALQTPMHRDALRDRKDEALRAVLEKIIE